MYIMFDKYDTISFRIVMAIGIWFGFTLVFSTVYYIIIAVINPLSITELIRFSVRITYNLILS